MYVSRPNTEPGHSDGEVLLLSNAVPAQPVSFPPFYADPTVNTAYIDTLSQNGAEKQQQRE